MTGFNQESQIPEKPQGHDESLRNPGDEQNAQPSEVPTDRFGLQAAGKSFLLRKYNIAESAAGNPYFVPIESVLASLVADAETVLELARAHQKTDDERMTRAELQAQTGLEYFAACMEAAGEDREWVARKRVIWPLTDDLGFQLYKAAAGLDDLADFGAYLIRTDANIQSLNDAQADERYEKRSFWSNLALQEAGELDDIIQTIESTDYNLAAMVREGYRSAANLDTRTHLQGVKENAPVDPENDVKSQLKQQLMAG